MLKISFVICHIKVDKINNNNTTRLVNKIESLLINSSTEFYELVTVKRLQSNNKQPGYKDTIAL